MEEGFGRMMETLHPEAAYFYPENGRRAGIIVFDLKSPSDLPSVVEPMFMNLSAEVNVSPAMTADDLKRGLKTVMDQMAAMQR